MRSSTFQDPSPRARCQGRGSSSKASWLTMVTVFLFSLFLSSNVQAQLNNCNNCTAKDIKAIGLRADIGDQATCVAGNINVDPDLYVDFEVTSAERYGFYLAYEVWIKPEVGNAYQFTTGSTNGVFVQTICSTNDPRLPGDPTGSGGILKKGFFDLKLIAEPTVPTGATIELRNVLTAWGNQIQEVDFFCTPAGSPTNGGMPLTDCGQITPKCKYYPGTVLDVLLVAKPTVQVMAVDPSVCAGENAVFKVSGTSGQGVTVTVKNNVNNATLATYTNFDGEEFLTINAPASSVSVYATTVKTLVTPPCAGDNSAVATVTVNPNPTITSIAGDTKCFGVKATATATASAGAIVWYDAQSGGNVVTDPSRTAVGESTFWAQAVNGECVSPRQSALVRVRTTPVVNSATGDVKCNIGQTLTASASVTPSDATITWWDAATGGNSATNTLTGVGTKTIWAQASIAYTNPTQTCVSPDRKSATLTLLTTPTVATIAGDTKCFGSKATATATASAGASIVWYDAATGGNVVADPSRTTVGSTIYYAEAVLGDCKSITRSPATVTIRTTPVVNSATGDVKCDIGQTLTATANVTPSDATITWWDAATGGNSATKTLTGVGTKTIWAQASIAYTNPTQTCTSPDRKSATLTLLTTPTVATIAGDTKCFGSKATATATASGGSIVWYDAATGGNVVADPSRTTVGSTIYYAEAVLGDCKSTSRSAATVTIRETPVVNSATGANECNSGQTLTATANVTPSNATITWWTAATGGTETSNTQTGVGEKTVWAQASLVYTNPSLTCTSPDRKSALLKIRETPTITSGGNQDACFTGQTLTATANASAGATIVWYNAATGGSVVTNPTLSSVGEVTYYAEAVKERCSSTTRAAVTLKLKNCDPGYCTYTQGAFGNEGGKDRYKKEGGCFQSSGASQTVDDALNVWGADGMKVGNMIFTGSKWPSANNAALIISYLPNGGPSKVFTGTTAAQLLSDGQKNTLLAQTITLGLNIGLNLAILDYELPVGTWYLSTKKSGNCGGTVEPNATAQCFKFVVSATMDVVGANGMAPGDGKVTVRDIWVLANRGLRGSGTNGNSLSAIAGVADAIANAFDECRIPTDWTREDPCAAAKLLASMILLESPSAVNAGAGSKNLTVKAYPNPFRDRVFISFTSPVSGKATVEIFDMTGRRLEAINKGQVVAGRENTVEYTVPFANRNSIIYRVTVDKFSVNGRLISPSK